MSRTLKIDEENRKRLESFKKIYDQIINEEQDFDHYVNVVIDIGLDKMRRDVIPEGQEWTTIELAFNKDFDFMCSLISDIWKGGKELPNEHKEAVKEKISRYIS